MAKRDKTTQPSPGDADAHSGSKRESAASVGIYRRHIALYRFLNDAWIFTHLLRPELKRKAVELLESTRKKDRQ